MRNSREYATSSNADQSEFHPVFASISNAQYAKHLRQLQAADEQNNTKLVAQFELMEKGAKEQIESLRASIENSDKDQLYKKMQLALAGISPEKLQQMFDKALTQGNPMAVRLLAQLAGFDLSERPIQAPDEGSKLIIIRPMAKEIAGNVQPDGSIEST